MFPVLTQSQARSALLKAHAYLQADEPAKSWAKFKSAERYTDRVVDWFARGVCASHGLGKHQLGLDCWTRMNALRGENQTRHWVLGSIWFSNIGHIALMDYVIKLALLNGSNTGDIVLWVPNPASTANPYLLDQFLQWITVVQREQDLPFPLDHVGGAEINLLAPNFDGKTRYVWGVAAEVYRQWEAKFPTWNLVTIPGTHAERARDYLSFSGRMPKDAEFVTLHVRASSSTDLHRGLHDVLNASIDDYLPAIKELTSRGLWVVRIGDTSMKPLPPMPNVIDYANSPVRDDWLDIYLLAKCKFFIGTASGPAYVPPLFGTPCVLTNWWPPGQRPWHARDIFIPKRYARKDGSFLTLRETLTEPFQWANSVKTIGRKHAVHVVDNDPQDIRMAAVEMLNRLEGQETVVNIDRTLQLRADMLQKDRGAYGAARLALHFLARNPGFVQ